MEKGRLFGILSIVCAVFPLLSAFSPLVLSPFSAVDTILFVHGLSLLLSIAGLILGIIAKKGSRKLGITGCILNSLMIVWFGYLCFLFLALSQL